MNNNSNTVIKALALGGQCSEDANIKARLEIIFKDQFSLLLSATLQKVTCKHKCRIINIQKFWRYAKLKGLASFNLEDVIANIVSVVGIGMVSSNLVPCMARAIGIGILLH